MNPFFRTDGERSPEPTKIYAKVDDFIPLSESAAGFIPPAVIFDGFDATWLDYRLRDEVDPYDYIEEASIYAIEFASDIPSEFMGIAEQEENGPWIEFSLSTEQADGPEVLVYRNMFGEPQSYFLTSKDPQILNDDLQALVNRTLSVSRLIENHPELEATEEDVFNILVQANGNGGGVLSAAVYDVGQGNCNALFGNACAPVMYYDFGGGDGRGAKSYPYGIKFCFTLSPPVVLSHWDKDHWCSAIKQHDALDLQWLVPEDNTIGASHRIFLADLVRRKNVKIWTKNTAPSVQLGQILLEKATGTSRNDSGIVLIVTDRNNTDYQYLFPGDADYPHIPSTSSGNKSWAGIVVPHHGAEMRSRSTPPPLNEQSLLVYSCAYPPVYDHPRPTTMELYENRGWKKVRTTRSLRPLMGHVLLNFRSNKGRTQRTPACRGTGCNLTLRQ